jgi:cytochrome c5
MSLNKARCLLAVLAMLPLISFADEAQSVEKGRAVYQSVCIACHAPENVMVSAPKAGDAAEWARRAGKGSAGLDMLTRHAIDGFGAMPAKGGHAELTTAQIRDAIVFMRAVPTAVGTAPAGTTR